MTRPLTPHAKERMRDMLRAPLPLPEVNAGLYRKLTEEGLAKVIGYASPYAKHKGGTCPHLTLTDAGKALAATF